METRLLLLLALTGPLLVAEVGAGMVDRLLLGRLLLDGIGTGIVNDNNGKVGGPRLLVDGPHHQRASLLDRKFRAFLERLRDSMRTGNSSLGLPVLDPYATDILEVDLVDPNIRVNGSLSALRIQGASRYDIAKATFQMAGIRFEADLRWPEIRLESHYQINGTLVDTIPFFGQGDISLKAKGVRITATASLGSKPDTRKLYLKYLDLGLHLQGLNMEVSGLWEDEEFSKTISAIISDMAPKALEDYQELAVDYCKNKVTVLANEYLGKYTLLDLQS